MGNGEVLGLAGSGQELIVTPPDNLAKPIQIVSAEVALMAGRLLPETLAFTEILDAEGFRRASEQLNTVSKCGKFISTQGTDLGAPFRAESARIKAEADKLAKPLLTDAVGHLNKLMAGWRVREAAERAAALAAQRKAIEDAQRLADQQRKLEEESKARQEAAAQAVEAAKTDAQFTEAAKSFDDGMAAQELATETKELAKAAVVQVQQTARAVVAPVKAKGAKEKMKATILEYDLAAMPVSFHLLNEPMLKKAIEGGLVTTEHKWVQFRLDPVFSGSGR